MGRRLRGSRPQRHRHARLHLIVGGQCRRGGRRKTGLLLGDINPRRRARLDDPLHQQQVIGPHHGVARYLQLFRQPARRRQARTRRDPRTPDRIANLIHHLGRQRVGPRAIEENGYLHDQRTAWVLASVNRSKGWASYESSRQSFDAISIAVSWFFRQNALALPVWQQLDSWRPVMPAAAQPGCRDCPKPPAFVHLLGSRHTAVPTETSFGGAFAFYRGGSRYLSIRRANVRALTDKRGAASRCSRSSNPTGAVMSTVRQRWLSAAAAVLAILGSGVNHARAEDTIKIGILHSLSGTMAISETILKDLMLMEVADVNAKGGLLGKQIEPVVVDPASNWPLFAEKARELLVKDKVAAVFGCWTSVSRKSVLPVFEELNGLLFYPLEYEGEEASYNIFYGSSVPDNKAVPAVEYLMSK